MDFFKHLNVNKYRKKKGQPRFKYLWSSLFSSWSGTCWTSVSTPSASPRRWRWSSRKCWWKSSVTRYQRWSRASLTQSTSTRSDWFKTKVGRNMKDGFQGTDNVQEKAWPVGLHAVTRFVLDWDWKIKRLGDPREKKTEEEGLGRAVIRRSELWIALEQRDSLTSTCDKCDKEVPPVPRSPKDNYSILYGDEAIHFLGCSRYNHYMHPATPPHTHTLTNTKTRWGIMTSP